VPELQQQCVICSSESFAHDKDATRSLALEPPFAVAKCVGCGFRWLNPRPTEAEYTLLYDRSYATDGSGHAANDFEWMRDYSVVPGDYSTDRQARKEGRLAARLAKFARLIPDAKSVLEVGVGTGEFLRLARDRGMEVAGLDLSEHACEKIRRELEIDVHCGSLGAYDPGARRYDIVHLHHVFEHLLDPKGALQQIRSLLTEQGTLVLEIPNQFECLAYVAGRWLPRGTEPQRTLWSVQHPYFYGRSHISRLVEDAGYQITHVTTFFSERASDSKWQLAQNAVRYLSDRLGGRGANIEIFAVPRRSDKQFENPQH
jgi:2-polyprenyl-3-methyl-5-hydroxy-6-metoxy-1,4-benzoquinol methylase